MRAGSDATPVVSVVVPNYNLARFLPQRIRSVLEQTFRDFEVIFVDDGSTDGSLEVFRQYERPPRVRLLSTAANSGRPAVAWNRGAAAARGRYLWFAEADDFADSDFLEQTVAVLERHPQVGLVHCQFRRVDEAGEIEDVGGRWWQELDGERWERSFVAPGREELAFMAYGNMISNASGVLVRRALYEQLGGADESYRLAADWHLWIRLLLVSDVGFVATPLNYWRWHGGTVRARMAQDGSEHREVERVLRFLADRTGEAPATTLARYHEHKARSALRWRHSAEARRHARALLALAPTDNGSWALGLASLGLTARTGLGATWRRLRGSLAATR